MVGLDFTFGLYSLSDSVLVHAEEGKRLVTGLILAILTKKHSYQMILMLEKLHPQASKEAKSGSRAVMPGRNQHLHFSLSHQ